MEWNEEDHPRAEDGKFTDGQGSSGRTKKFKQNTSYDEILAEDGEPRDYIELPKREYAELCSAIRTKYVNRIPRKGQMLYGNNYYRFAYDKSQERIVCKYKLGIDGNEEIISKLLKEFR